MTRNDTSLRGDRVSYCHRKNPSIVMKLDALPHVQILFVPWCAICLVTGVVLKPDKNGNSRRGQAPQVPLAQREERRSVLPVHPWALHGSDGSASMVRLLALSQQAPVSRITYFVGRLKRVCMARVRPEQAGQFFLCFLMSRKRRSIFSATLLPFFAARTPSTCDSQYTRLFCVWNVSKIYLPRAFWMASVQLLCCTVVIAWFVNTTKQNGDKSLACRSSSLMSAVRAAAHRHA